MQKKKKIHRNKFLINHDIFKYFKIIKNLKK